MTGSFVYGPDPYPNFEQEPDPKRDKTHKKKTRSWSNKNPFVIRPDKKLLFIIIVVVVDHVITYLISVTTQLLAHPGHE